MSDDMIVMRVDERGIATLSLNRPEVRNAFDDALISQLTEALLALNAQADVRAVILTGTGHTFSAGADINWMRSMAGFRYPTP